MEELKSWLDNPGRDYFAGVKLYEKYGDDVRLKMRVFPAGPFINNQTLLHYELEKVYKTLSKTDKAETDKTILSRQEEKTEIIKPVLPVIAVQTDPKQGYLRKEFPKLKFEDLPDDLKVLVIDARISYGKAQKAREEKFNANTDEERLEHNLTEIENRLENKLIWKELNHFQETGMVLGEHPRFAQKKEIAKLQELSREELFKKKQNFPSAISKANKAIREAGEDEDLIAKKKSLLDKYEWQEREVDRLLGL